jgi:hypothetical protein
VLDCDYIDFFLLIMAGGENKNSNGNSNGNGNGKNGNDNGGNGNGSPFICANELDMLVSIVHT